MMIDELVEKEELTNFLNINCRDISLLIQGFISNSVTNAGADGVVLGLSGGVDSTVAESCCKSSSKGKNIGVKSPRLSNYFKSRYR